MDGSKEESLILFSDFLDDLGNWGILDFFLGEWGKLAKIPENGDPWGPHWELYIEKIKLEHQVFTSQLNNSL